MNVVAKHSTGMPARPEPVSRVETTRRRRSMRVMHAMRWLIALLFLCSACILSSMTVVQAVTAGELARESQAAMDKPTEEQEAAWNRALEYNRRIAADGPAFLANAIDPFTRSDQTPPSEKDKDYMSQLSLDGDDVMGSVSIPSINVRLPIRHGTTQKVLDQGAGHMYGTSLPVGGESSRTVISAHNGLPDKLLFTHLDELKQGSPFYLHVMGHTLAYKVTTIEVVDPNDYKRLLIHQGRDEATLLTCTPYGLNTKRLLVTGVRASMPDEVPYENDAPTRSTPFTDLPGLASMAGVGATPVAVGYTVWTGWSCHRENRLSPWGRRK